MRAAGFDVSCWDDAGDGLSGGDNAHEDGTAITCAVCSSCPDLID